MNHSIPGMISHNISTDLIQSSVMSPPSPVYCKTTTNHLKSLTELERGLTNQEISAVESSLGFSFPPDLRSILQTGLPVGAHFPNWRSGSTRNHLLFLNLPLLHVSEMVAKNGFWLDCWGIRPESNTEALAVVKKLMDMAPVLVPVYRNFYVPSTTPNLAGNPVLQVNSIGVRVLSCDVVGFLQGLNELGDFVENPSDTQGPRKVEFWSEVAERAACRDELRGWWSTLSSERLRACLDDAFWKLREGGWTEHEVREMMMMTMDDRRYTYTPEDDGDGSTCTDAPEDHQKSGQVKTLKHLFYSSEA